MYRECTGLTKAATVPILSLSDDDYTPLMLGNIIPPSSDYYCNGVE
jgi:hypothetical protein